MVSHSGAALTASAGLGLAYGYIFCEPDEDLEKLGKAPKEEAKVIVCPRCGAPYTDEVYKGQVTVNCRYCGSSIAV